jgi:hypothetical protein
MRRVDLRRMRPDRYTKIVLTVIAFMLTVIACRTVVSPAATAQAQATLAGVQYSGPNAHFFFDTRTGDLWAYSDEGRKDESGEFRDHWEWDYWGKVTKLGQTLTGGSIDSDGVPKSEKRK